MKFKLLGLLLVVTLVLQGQTSHVVFVDVTKQAGIRFDHCMGDKKLSNILEATGSGCAFFDYDGDGWMDIYVVNGCYLEGISDPKSPFKGMRMTSHLYHNNGDGTFSEVTEKAGVSNEGRYGMGCQVGDYDNDGHPDLYVTSYGRNTLYHNNGNGTFTDATDKAGVGVNKWSTGAAWFDYDKDGYLDLFVANYLDFDPEYRLYYEADIYPGPLAYPAQTSVLFHNNHDGTFTDVTEKAGVNKKGRGMGALTVDYDGDGWPDIFVANDATANFLYHNNGNGTFTEIGLTAGVAFGQNGNASASMGGDWRDYDMDGMLDLLVPAMGYNALYRNLGKGAFQEMAVETGLAVISGQYWSWGGKFLDYDNDGYVDVMVVNGDGHRLTETQEPILARNSLGRNGKRTFQDVANQSGPYFELKAVARGLAIGDFDNDGDLDALILNINQPSVLIRNDGGNRNNWIMLDLVGTRSNRDGFGAKVTVRAGSLVQVDEKKSGTSYLSSNDPRMHFGLNKLTKVDEVTVKWPSGVTQKLRDLKVNQVVKVTEPRS
ncbi:MAG TPA: CRTAC1 family protein [Terriglobia bacterium]|nr:CRTAC1 family protein [Terriglobia bacterium]